MNEHLLSKPNGARDFISSELLRIERRVFAGKLLVGTFGYVGVTLWFNAVRQTAAISLVWVLIALQLACFFVIFVVCWRRAQQCGFRHTWLMIVPLILSRINDWELVILPALMVIMLILSARNRHVSAEHQHLMPNSASAAEGE